MNRIYQQSEQIECFCFDYGVRKVSISGYATPQYPTGSSKSQHRRSFEQFLEPSRVKTSMHQKKSLRNTSLKQSKNSTQTEPTKQTRPVSHNMSVQMPSKPVIAPPQKKTNNVKIVSQVEVFQELSVPNSTKNYLQSSINGNLATGANFNNKASCEISLNRKVSSNLYDGLANQRQGTENSLKCSNQVMGSNKKSIKSVLSSMLNERTIKKVNKLKKQASINKKILAVHEPTPQTHKKSQYRAQYEQQIAQNFQTQSPIFDSSGPYDDFGRINAFNEASFIDNLDKFEMKEIQSFGSDTESNNESEVIEKVKHPSQSKKQFGVKYITSLHIRGTNRSIVPPNVRLG